MKIYTVEVSEEVTKWKLDGKLHREDGPALEYANGTKFWCHNGEWHREDGPALEYANGTKFWYQNGKRHREDGPATERADGSKEWWINGEQLSEQEFLARKQAPCAGKIVEIDGRKYKLVLA